MLTSQLRAGRPAPSASSGRRGPSGGASANDIVPRPSRRWPRTSTGPDTRGPAVTPIVLLVAALGTTWTVTEVEPTYVTAPDWSRTWARRGSTWHAPSASGTSTSGRFWSAATVAAVPGTGRAGLRAAQTRRPVAATPRSAAAAAAQRALDRWRRSGSPA